MKRLLWILLLVAACNSSSSESCVDSQARYNKCGRDCAPLPPEVEYGECFCLRKIRPKDLP